MNFLSWVNRLARPQQSPETQDSYDNVLSELDRARRFDRPLSLIAFDIRNTKTAAALRSYAKSHANVEVNSKSHGRANNVRTADDISTDHQADHLGASPKLASHPASKHTTLQTLADSKRAHDIVFELEKPSPMLIFVCPETTHYDARLAAKRLNTLVRGNDGRVGIASFPKDGVSIPLLIEQATKNMKNNEECATQEALRGVG